eukprot:3784201-Pyramimonas_sp.AAC.1
MNGFGILPWFAAVAVPNISLDRRGDDDGAGGFLMQARICCSFRGAFARAVGVSSSYATIQAVI